VKPVLQKDRRKPAVLYSPEGCGEEVDIYILCRTLLNGLGGVLQGKPGFESRVCGCNS